MTRAKLSRRLARPFRDFLAGLLAFGGVTVSGLIAMPESGAGWLASSAHAGRVAPHTLEGIMEVARTIPAGGQQHQVLSLICLGLAFASMLALNLWFARHLRRAYVVSRRRR